MRWFTSWLSLNLVPFLTDTLLRTFNLCLSWHYIALVLSYSIVWLFLVVDYFDFTFTTAWRFNSSNSAAVLFLWRMRLILLRVTLFIVRYSFLLDFFLWCSRELVNNFLASIWIRFHIAKRIKRLYLNSAFSLSVVSYNYIDGVLISCFRRRTLRLSIYKSLLLRRIRLILSN